MIGDNKVKGPASYFPSIEKNYGQLIDHWLNLLAWLKTEHGMGHGHANALVAHHLASKEIEGRAAMNFTHLNVDFPKAHYLKLDFVPFAIEERPAPGSGRSALIRKTRKKPAQGFVIADLAHSRIRMYRCS